MNPYRKMPAKGISILLSVLILNFSTESSWAFANLDTLAVPSKISELPLPAADSLQASPQGQNTQEQPAKIESAQTQNFEAPEPVVLKREDKPQEKKPDAAPPKGSQTTDSKAREQAFLNYVKRQARMKGIPLKTYMNTHGQQTRRQFDLLYAGFDFDSAKRLSEEVNYQPSPIVPTLLPPKAAEDRKKREQERIAQEEKRRQEIERLRQKRQHEQEEREKRQRKEQQEDRDKSNAEKAKSEPKKGEDKEQEFEAKAAPPKGEQSKAEPKKREADKQNKKQAKTEPFEAKGFKPAPERSLEEVRYEAAANSLHNMLKQIDAIPDKTVPQGALDWPEVKNQKALDAKFMSPRVNTSFYLSGSPDKNSQQPIFYGKHGNDVLFQGDPLKARGSKNSPGFLGGNGPFIDIYKKALYSGYQKEAFQKEVLEAVRVWQPEVATKLEVLLNMPQATDEFYPFEYLQTKMDMLHESLERQISENASGDLQKTKIKMIGLAREYAKDFLNNHKGELKGISAKAYSPEEQRSWKSHTFQWQEGKGLTGHSHGYTYHEPENQGSNVLWLDPANKKVGGGYAGNGTVLEEKMLLSMYYLWMLAIQDRFVDSKKAIWKIAEDAGGQIMIFDGVPHSSYLQDDIYGAKFTNFKADMLKAGSMKPHKIAAVALHDFSKSEKIYTTGILIKTFDQFYTAFQNAQKHHGVTRINTTGVGSGVFGHPAEVSYILQTLAAKAAGFDLQNIHYHMLAGDVQKRAEQFLKDVSGKSIELIFEEILKVSSFDAWKTYGEKEQESPAGEPAEQSQAVAEQLLQFYKGELKIVPSEGLEPMTFQEILDLDNDAWEKYHDYIQWLFPLNKASEVRANAPVLSKEDVQALKADPAVKDALQIVFERFAQFLGVQYKDGQLTSQNPSKLHDLMHKLSDMQDPLAHNLLRIDRVLRSLHLLGQEGLAKQFFDLLSSYNSDSKEPLGEPGRNSLEEYWKKYKEVTEAYFPVLTGKPALDISQDFDKKPLMAFLEQGDQAIVQDLLEALGPRANEIQVVTDQDVETLVKNDLDNTIFIDQGALASRDNHKFVIRAMRDDLYQLWTGEKHNSQELEEKGFLVSLMNFQAGELEEFARFLNQYQDTFEWQNFFNAVQPWVPSEISEEISLPESHKMPPHYEEFRDLVISA